MGQTLQKPALRPMLPADIPVLATIFTASIDELTRDDYSEQQRAAWMSRADDEAEFAASLNGQLTLIATLNHSAVGFASLKDNNHIEMLFVHPGAVGHGVATVLCDALEKLAAARGATKLSTDASDTAHGFFLRRGFVDQHRNTVTIQNEWLANTTMSKELTPAGAAPQGTSS